MDLRQGDSLSSFLFILAMESLHVAMEDVVQERLYRGMVIGDGELHLSHLFYAYDAIFFGDSNRENILNLIVICGCFYLVSGLKVNMQKIKFISY